MKKQLYFLIGAVIIGTTGLLAVVYATVSAILLPNGDGTYMGWQTSTGTVHYVNVDDQPCNGNTDYNYVVSSTPLGTKDSYTIDLSSVPNGSTITKIGLNPCASVFTNVSGTSSTLRAFFIFNGGAELQTNVYIIGNSTTIPFQFTTTTRNISVLKTATSTLQVGAEYFKGDRGLKLSNMRVELTY